jgi:carbonic anhydrase
VSDIIYRYDPENCPSPPPPTSAAEARRRLEDGNREFSRLLDPILGKSPPVSRVIPFDPVNLGLCLDTGKPPKQQPFAVVLGCSDARVPTELIFNAGCNDLFVVRVAGNVLGSECLGSIDYAVHNFGSSVKLLVVLGHSGCGAVTAAVDAFLDASQYLAVASSHQLRAIVDRLFAAVRASAQSLEAIWGADIHKHPNYRKALVSMSVAMNAALVASVLKKEFANNHSGLDVVYSIYDLTERRLRLPGLAVDVAVPEVGLADPPADFEGYRQLGLRLGHCNPVVTQLK